MIGRAFKKSGKDLRHNNNHHNIDTRSVPRSKNHHETEKRRSSKYLIPSDVDIHKAHRRESVSFTNFMTKKALSQGAQRSLLNLFSLGQKAQVIDENEMEIEDQIKCREDHIKSLHGGFKITGKAGKEENNTEFFLNLIDQQLNYQRIFKDCSNFTEEYEATLIAVDNTVLEDSINIKEIKVFIPGEGFKLRWDTFLAFLIVYSLITVPYFIGFNFQGDNKTITSLDYIVDSCFYLDIIFAFNTAYYDKKKQLVENRCSIAYNYLKYGFWIDFVSCFPFEVLANLYNVPGDENTWRSFKLARLLRLAKILRLIRTFKLANFLKKQATLTFKEKSSAFYILMSALKLALPLFFIAHLLACAWHYLIAWLFEDVDTWMNNMNLTLEEGAKYNWMMHAYALKNITIDSQTAEPYRMSIYWALTTMTTVGYGDIVPILNNEKILAMVAMVIGGTVFGFIVGSVTLTIEGIDMQAKYFQEKMTIIDGYLREKSIPSAIKDRVKKHFKYCFRKLYVNDDSWIQRNLPQGTLIRLSFLQYGQVISSIPFLQDQSPAFVAGIAPLLLPATIHDGEVLLRTGDLGMGVYFIISGNLECYIKINQCYEKFKVLLPGDFVGHVGVFKETELYTVQAAGDVEIYWISKRNLYNVLCLCHTAKSMLLNAVKSTQKDIEDFKLKFTISKLFGNKIVIPQNRKYRFDDELHFNQLMKTMKRLSVDHPVTLGQGPNCFYGDESIDSGRKLQKNDSPKKSGSPLNYLHTLKPTPHEFFTKSTPRLRRLFTKRVIPEPESNLHADKDDNLNNINETESTERNPIIQQATATGTIEINKNTEVEEGSDNNSHGNNNNFASKQKAFPPKPIKIPNLMTTWEVSESDQENHVELISTRKKEKKVFSNQKEPESRKRTTLYNVPTARKISLSHWTFDDLDLTEVEQNIDELDKKNELSPKSISDIRSSKVEKVARRHNRLYIRDLLDAYYGLKHTDNASKYLVPEALWEDRSLFHPESKWKHYWDLTICACIVYSVLSITFRIGFGIPYHEGSFWSIFDICIILMFFIDIIINFNTAYWYHGELIVEREKIFKNYLFGWFFVDFISTVPFESTASAVGLSSHNLLKLLRFARLFRVLRIMKMNALFTKYEDQMSISPGAVRLIKLISTMICVAHLHGSIFYYTGTEHGHPTSWINNYCPEVSLLEEDNFCVSDMQLTFKYVSTFYWSLTTMVTVGWGDITPDPRSEGEVAWTVITQLIGATFFAYNISTMVELVSNMNPGEKLRKEEKAGFSDYLNSLSWGKKNTSRYKLMKMLGFQFYFYLNERSVFPEEDIIDQIPAFLRVPLTFYNYKATSRQIDFLQGLENKFRGASTVVLPLFKPAIYRKGEIMMTAQTGVRECWFILSGVVSIRRSNDFKRKKGNILKVSRGSFIGEATLLLPNETPIRYINDVLAETNVQILILKRNDFEYLQYYYPEVADFLRYSVLNISIDSFYKWCQCAPSDFMQIMERYKSS